MDSAREVLESTLDRAVGIVRMLVGIVPYMSHICPYMSHICPSWYSAHASWYSAHARTAHASSSMRTIPLYHVSVIAHTCQQFCQAYKNFSKCSLYQKYQYRKH